MSKLQVDTIVDKEDVSAPTLSKGAIVTGVTTSTSFAGALTGDVTGNITGNQSGGSVNATSGDFSTNVAVTKQTTSEHINATGISTAGIGTITTSVVVGSAVTSNADGIVAAGIVTAGTCFKTGDGVFGAGIGATITGAGDAVFAGVTTTSGNSFVGAAISMYASAGIVSATSYDGDGSRLTGISAGAWENLTSGSWTSGTTKDITTTHLTSSHQLYRLTFHFHLDDAGESGAGLRVYTGGAWQSSGYTNRYLADDLSAVQTNRNRFPFGASATMMRECMGTGQFAYPEEVAS